MKRLLAIALIALTTLFFAAVKNPDTIIDVTIGEPDTLDPHHAYDTASGEVIYNIYENLIQYKGSSLSEFEPRLATRWEILDGGKTYKFYIRKGVKFHNGDPLTPEDVEYSFERGLILDPAGGPIWMLWDAIFGIDSLESFVEQKLGVAWKDLFDEAGNVKPEYHDKLVEIYTKYIDPAIEVEGDAVVFHLVRPFGPFLNVIAQSANWAAILDKEWCVSIGCWDGKAEGWWKYHDIKKEDSPLYARANGTGPFKLVEWNRTEKKVILERNDDYWREPAKIKKVIIWTVPEWSTRRAMLEKGDADIVAVPTQYLPQIEGMPGITVIKPLPTLVVTSLHFNWTVNKDSKYIGSGKLDGNGIPPDFFSDIHVRRAFVCSMNYDALIEDVLHGLGRRVPTDLPEGLLGFDEELLYDEYAPRFDLGCAEEEFRKAWGGRLWEKGFKMTLLYNLGNDVRRVAAEMLKTYIESLNPKFHIDVMGVEWPTYLDAMRHEMLPAFIIGWLADYPDPHNFIFTYYSSMGVYGGRQGEKFREFVSAKRDELGGKSLDDLILQAAKETDPQKRKELYLQVQKFAMKYALGAPLYQGMGFRVQRSWVKGWYYNPMRPGDDYYILYKSEE